ncbi:MAG: SCO family protein [Chloroflexota bacterium]
MDTLQSQDGMTLPESKQALPLSLLIKVFVGSALFAAAILFPLLMWLLAPAEPVPYYMQGNPEGVRQLTQPRELIDFMLPSTTGEALSLSDLRGQPVLLFFGYTHCPDVCLLTLSDVNRTLDLVGEDVADNIQVVFVGVDPARDTLERMSSLFTTYRIQEHAIGLQGEDITLQRISPDYSLYYQRHEDEGDNYTVDHTASVYFIMPNGQLDTIFAYGTLPTIMADHIVARLAD